MRRNSRAFTLIEILVVVAIIALLIAILLPTLSSARAGARKSVCLSNLHQAGAALLVYATQYRDYVPRGGNVQRYWSDGDMHWTLVLLKNVDSGLKNVLIQANQAGTGTSTFNGKSYENRGIALNALLWQELRKFPLFQCPERAAGKDNPGQSQEALSYMVNSYEPLARAAGGPGFWDVNVATKLSAWKSPASTVYLADLERCSVSTSTIAPAYLVPGTGVGDLSYFDAFTTSDLPSSSGPLRRFARAIHTQRWTNGLFVDGHSTGVDALPRPGEVTLVNPYSTVLSNPYCLRWVRLVGVRDP